MSDEGLTPEAGGAPDPLAALGHRLVGKADDGEPRQAGRKLGLDLDGSGFEPEISDSGDGRGHYSSLPRKREPSSAKIWVPAFAGMTKFGLAAGRDPPSSATLC